MLHWIRSHKLIATLAAFAMLCGVYAALGFWALPKLARSLAGDYVAQTLKHELSIGELRFNPFTFELDARALELRQPGAAASGGTLLALDRAYVNFQLSSLWRRAWVFDRVLLEKPYVHALLREDGSLNLFDLVPPDDGQSSPMPALEIGEISLQQGQLDFADHRSHSKPQSRLVPIDFSLGDFRTTAQSGGFHFSAASDQGERFGLSGILNLQPFSVHGDFDIQAVQLHSLYRYFADQLPMQLSAGTVDMAGNYALSTVADGTALELTLPRIEFAGLALRARNQDQDWLRLARATLENSRLSLQQRTIAIDALHLDGLSSDVWLERDGSVNLMQLFSSTESPNPVSVSAGPTSPPSTPATATAAPPTDQAWQFSLGKLVLDRGELHFEDRRLTPAVKFHATPIAIEIDALSLDLSKSLPVRLRAQINQRIQLAIDGSVIPAQGDIDAQVELSGLGLSDLSAYLPAYPNMLLQSGSIAGKGRLQRHTAAENSPLLRFDGELSLLKLALADAASKRQVLSWERMDASGIALALGPDSLAIERIQLLRPYAQVDIAEDGSLNLVRVLAATDSAAAAAAEPAGQGAASTTFPLRIDTVQLKNAVMSFADRSIEPSFQARIEALNGHIKRLSTAANAVAAIDLKGQLLNRHSPVTIKGTTNLLAYARHTDIQMAFSNIDLPIFNPYSGRFAGYAIAKGKLTTDLHYRIDDSKLQAEHHVRLDQLEWGEATDSKDKVSLPVRLATSLLKDRHGVIDLNLPVNGSLDDPQFKFGPIVWQVLKNIVSKIVTAPFAMLGSLFGGAAEQAQYITFAPGSAELTAPAQTALAALAQGLVERPALTLEVPAGALAELDGQALALARIEQALAVQEKIGEVRLVLDDHTPERQVKLLEKLYRQQTGNKPRMPELAAADADAAATDISRSARRAAREQTEAAWLRQELMVRNQPTAEELQALGRARADAIQNALLGNAELAAERIFIATGTTPASEAGKIRLDLQLQ